MRHQKSKEKDQDACCSGGYCGCYCHKALAVLVVLFGLTFLLGALHVISDRIVDLAWPSLIILGGLVSLCQGYCRCCRDSDCCKDDDKK